MNANYKKALQELNKTVDGVGLGVDSGIKHSVAAFNSVGFKTSASCEGHTDHGHPFPWVDFGTSDFAGELEQPPAFLGSFVADLHQFTIDHDIEADFGLHAYIDKDDKRYVIVSGSDGHRRLYLEDVSKNAAELIEQVNKTQAEKMLGILQEFYASNPTPYGPMLSMQFRADYMFRLQPNDAEVMAGLPASKRTQKHTEYLDHFNKLADYLLVKFS